MALRRVFFLSMIAMFADAQTPACTSCPTNGIWSDWTSGSCSATCGLFGTMTQTRTCTSAALGCPCDGSVTSRTIACPVAPLCTGTVAQQCMAPYGKWANKATKRNECGNVTSSADYVAPACVMNGPACGFCTSATPNPPIVTNDDSFGNTPFDSDVVTTDSNGCSVRTLTCTSTATVDAPWPASISANTDATLCQSADGDDSCSAAINCNTDGTAWTFTQNSVTNDITRLGCLAVSCESYPDYC